MTKGTKIAVWSVGGLVVGTGLFFLIRALIKRRKREQPVLYGCTNKKADNYNPNATQDNGSCKYGGTPSPNGNGTKPPKVKGGLFPIRFGDKGDHVKDWQKGMVAKNGDDWCSCGRCLCGTYKNPISIDGDFGEQTALYTMCHYRNTDCAKCPLYGKGSTYPIGSADYSRCSVSESLFNSVVGSGASEKYAFGGGYSYAEGTPEPKTDIELGKEGGCPCWEGETEYNPCCMPDYENIATPNMNPYSNMAGQYQEHRGYMNMGGFSGEITNDEYLNMGWRYSGNKDGLKQKFNWKT